MSLLPCLTHPFGLFLTLPCQLLIQETSHSFVQPKDSPFWFLSSSLELNIRTVPPPFPRPNALAFSPPPAWIAHSRGLGPSELLAKPVRSRPVLGRWSVFLGFRQPNTLVNDEWVAKEVGPSRMVVRLRWNLLKGHQFANVFFHFIHGNTHENQIYSFISSLSTSEVQKTQPQNCFERTPNPYNLWWLFVGDENCDFVCRFYLLLHSFTSSERDTLSPRGLGLSECKHHTQSDWSEWPAAGFFQHQGRPTRMQTSKSSKGVSLVVGGMIVRNKIESWGFHPNAWAWLKMATEQTRRCCQSLIPI